MYHTTVALISWRDYTCQNLEKLENEQPTRTSTGFCVLDKKAFASKDIKSNTNRPISGRHGRDTNGDRASHIANAMRIAA